MSSQQVSRHDRSIYVARPQTDEEMALIRALQADLDRGFDGLVRYYGSYARKVVREIVYPDDVDDVVQEAFLRAYVALKGYEPERVEALKLRSWLRIVMRNTAINWYHGCREREEVCLSLEVFEDGSLQLSEDPFDESPGDVAVGRNEKLRRGVDFVREYLMRSANKARNREIWSLYIDKGWTQRAIGEELGCSAAVVGYVIREVQQYVRMRENDWL